MDTILIPSRCFSLPSAPLCGAGHFLGDKVSGETFSAQDVEPLTTLSHSSSIALKNASLYSEVKSRKEELERFYRLTVGRELRMAELKKKIEELEKKLKEKGRDDLL